ncbi:hypothetical protein PHPALM_27823 [Phytophthora palmivora]|uniref:Uncharacterized protein n=1 Tax=Phytophthora palmivora TaxID=4796 RepID=A0A2P4XBP6_9STRA|nr:hypothetical protein PHPALM_27823 [Phytophthora palmivora]
MDYLMAITVKDEATLWSRAAFNRMEVYIKGKLHKWVTKLFMICCLRTPYCIRYVTGVFRTEGWQAKYPRAYISTR